MTGIKNSALFFVLFVFILACNSETETPTSSTDDVVKPAFEGKMEWVKTFGGSLEDIAAQVITTSDGGMAVVGSTLSTDGTFAGKQREGADIFLLKLDSEGNVQWTKTYGGSGDDRGQSVTEAAGGGYFVLGYSASSDGDGSNNEGFHDNWLIRIDASGTILWEKSFGFKGHDHSYNVILTKDDGVFFNGFIDVTGSEGAGNDTASKGGKHGAGEFWCHKLDAQGNLEWRRFFGGTSNDRSFDSIEVSSGGFVLAGLSESTDFDITSPKGGYDFWVVKIDDKGTLVWQKSIGGSLTDTASAIVEDKNGKFLIYGDSSSEDGNRKTPKGGTDGWLVTLSAQGELISERATGGSQFDSGRDAYYGKDGLLWLTGATQSGGVTGDFQKVVSMGNNDAFLIQMSSSQEILKTITLGGLNSDTGESVTAFDTGEVIMVGGTESNEGLFSGNAGGKDIFISKWK